METKDCGLKGCSPELPVGLAPSMGMMSLSRDLPFPLRMQPVSFLNAQLIGPEPGLLQYSFSPFSVVSEIFRSVMVISGEIDGI